MMKNKYRNYAEQTSDNVIITGTYDGETENIWEDIYVIIDNLTTDESILLYLNENVVDVNSVDYGSDEWYEIRNEHIWQTMEGIYVIYTVDLKGGKYTSEHERLEIVWSEQANSYVMPCYAFGMPWSMVGVNN